MDWLNTETAAQLIDKLFAVPVLFAFLVDKLSDYRIKNKLIETIRHINDNA